MVEIRTMIGALVNCNGCVIPLPIPKYVKYQTMLFDIKMLSISFSTGREFTREDPSKSFPEL